MVLQITVFIQTREAASADQLAEFSELIRSCVATAADVTDVQTEVRGSSLPPEPLDWVLFDPANCSTPATFPAGSVDVLNQRHLARK